MPEHSMLFFPCLLCPIFNPLVYSGKLMFKWSCTSLPFFIATKRIRQRKLFCSWYFKYHFFSSTLSSFCQGCCESHSTQWTLASRGSSFLVTESQPCILSDLRAFSIGVGGWSCCCSCLQVWPAARLSMRSRETCTNMKLKWLATQAPTEQCLYHALVNTDSTHINKHRDSPPCSSVLVDQDWHLLGKIQFLFRFADTLIFTDHFNINVGSESV